MKIKALSFCLLATVMVACSKPATPTRVPDSRLPKHLQEQNLADREPSLPEFPPEAPPPPPTPRAKSRGEFGYNISGLNYLGYGYDAAFGPSMEIGVVGQHNSGATSVVTRYTRSGMINSTFNGATGFHVASNALLGAGTFLRGVNFQTDSRQLVIGKSANSVQYHLVLMRYTSNAGLDTSFGTVGWIARTLGTSGTFGHHVVVDTQGRSVAVGHYAPAPNKVSAILARFQTNGTFDTSFNTTGWMAFTAVGPYSQGYRVFLDTLNRINITGNARITNGGNYRMLVARMLSDGGFDTSFATTGWTIRSYARADEYGMALSDSGVGGLFVVGGAGTVKSRNAMIVRLLSDGTLDTSFATAGYLLKKPDGYSWEARGIGIDANNRPIWSLMAFDKNIWNEDEIVRLTTNGINDLSLDVYHSKCSLSLAVHTSGTYFSPSCYQQYNHISAPAFLVWQGVGYVHDAGRKQINYGSDISFTLTNYGYSDQATGITTPGLSAPFSFPGGSFPGGGTCGVTLDSGADCTMIVRFTPTVYNTQSHEALVINYSHSLSTANSGYFPLAVTGATTAITFDSSGTLDYGRIKANGPGYAQTVTAYSGDAYCTVTASNSDVRFTLDSGGGNCVSAYITSGGGCSENVRFIPTAANTPYSNTYSITCAEGGTFTKTLIGTGGTAAGLAFNTNFVDYGAISQGSTYAPIHTLTNTGDALATSLSVAFDTGASTHTWAITYSDCGTELAPGASCVNYGGVTTTDSTTSEGKDLIASYAEGADVTKSLSVGAGLADLSHSDDAYDYGNVCPGSAVEKTYTITNDNAAFLSGLGGTNSDGNFTFTGGTYPGTGGTCTTELDASANCTIKVTFTAARLGRSNNAITMSGDGSISDVNNVTAISTINACDADADAQTVGAGDCNDADATIYTGATEVCGDAIDQDCTGGNNNGCTDTDSDGYFSTGTNSDCDDGNAAIHPGASEVCGNGADEDCSGATNNGCTDADSDGYYSAGDSVDCNEGDAAINPGASEICGNGTDEDCSGANNNGCTDSDADGYYSSGSNPDCADADAAINPGATEACGDGVDQDCTGGNNNGCTDTDGDGYFTTGASVDCDDNAAGTNPGATEICGNGVDEDCSGANNNGCTDADGDGYFTTGNTDCDDGTFGINPGATEVCGDATDQDCTGGNNNGCTDGDSDGYFTTGVSVDCDDASPGTNPGASETCGNGAVDEDCSGGGDNGCTDADGDGYFTTGVDPDCDDTNVNIYPGNGCRTDFPMNYIQKIRGRLKGLVPGLFR